jgi:hypothetical protein
MPSAAADASQMRRSPSPLSYAGNRRVLSRGRAEREDRQPWRLAQQRKGRGEKRRCEHLGVRLVDPPERGARGDEESGRRRRACGEERREPDEQDDVQESEPAEGACAKRLGRPHERRSHEGIEPEVRKILAAVGRLEPRLLEAHARITRSASVRLGGDRRARFIAITTYSPASPTRRSGDADTSAITKPRNAARNIARVRRPGARNSVVTRATANRTAAG